MSGMIPQDNTTRKQCSDPDCLKWLPATPEFFHKDKTMKDGLCPQCKECKCRKRREHRARPEVLERERASNRLYYQTYYQRPGVLEHRLENNRTRYHRPEVIEEIRAYDRTYHRQPEQREKRRTYYQSYYSRPETKEKILANGRARRARELAVQGTHTPEQIQAQLKRQRYRCYYAACGFAKFKRVKENGKWKYTYHVEHTFPLSRVENTDIPANDMGYIVLACEECNKSKSTKFPWEWVEGGRLL